MSDREEVKESIKDAVEIGCSLHLDHEDCIELFHYIKQLEQEKEALKCCGNCKFEGMHNYCNYTKGGCNMNSLHLGKTNLWQPKES